MIQFDKIELVAKITLDRSEKYNSFIKEMAFEFQERLDECSQNDTIRSILITGQGKAFCAGQDLQEAIDPKGPNIKEIVQKHYNPIIKKIRQINKPVIAAVNGIAAGAGANLALACDLILASKSAGFIQAFSKIGLIPDSGGTYFLPRLIGFQKAAALMMTGDTVNADEAEKMGMIYKVYEDDKFEEESLKFAQKISEMPTKSLGNIKYLLSKSFDNTLASQLEIEAETQAMSAKTKDHQEGVNAFLEKRKPSFSGK